MDFHNHDDDEEEEGPTVPIPLDALDCSDFFATLLTRKYPEVEAELVFVAPTLWRPHRRITIPNDVDYSVEEIDKFCFELQERIFWEREFLITYNITKAQVEETND